MTQIYPQIRSMTWEEATGYGLINHGLMMQNETIIYKLNAGSADTIHVFKAGVVLFVVTINLRLDYLSLDAYLGSEDEPIDSIFLQGQDAIKEFIGSNWQTLSLVTITTRLIQLFA